VETRLAKEATLRSAGSQHRSRALDRFAWTAGVLCLSGISLLGTTAQSEIVTWVWSGAVTSRSAVVKAKLTVPPRTTRLLLTGGGESSRGITPRAVLPQGAADVVAFDLNALEPSTLYSYAIEGDGRRSERLGQFRTFPTTTATRWEIAFGSCAKTGSKHRIFDTIRKLSPLFFLHMGDFHYENISDDAPARFQEAFDRVLTSPTQSRLYRSTAIVYVWDDHDFGANDADGTSASGLAALRTYRQYVPHYPLTREGDTTRTIQQVFDVGRVRFLLTDTRAARDPVDDPDGPGKSMLGDAQREWLLRELSRAARESALTVWVNPVPWITRSQPGTDHGWEPFGHERRSIANHIASLGLADRLLMLSGDGHMVAIDDGTNSNYAQDHPTGQRAFPVMHAAPLHRYARTKGGPYSHGVAGHRRLWGLLQDKQFGRMQVRDDGDAIEVELSGHDSKGTQLGGMYLSMRCAPSCRITSRPPG
jgi:alkaline phosphatase D